MKTKKTSSFSWSTALVVVFLVIFSMFLFWTFSFIAWITVLILVFVTPVKFFIIGMIALMFIVGIIILLKSNGKKEKEETAIKIIAKAFTTTIIFAIIIFFFIPYSAKGNLPSFNETTLVSLLRHLSGTFLLAVTSCSFFGSTKHALFVGSETKTARMVKNLWHGGFHAYYYPVKYLLTYYSKWEALKRLLLTWILTVYGLILRPWLCLTIILD